MEKTKEKKQTTNPQWDVILEHMNKNPNLARGVPAFGSNRKEVEDSWEELGKMLNAIGPPTRDWKEWKKIWLDLKGRTKKKLAENKLKLTGTGGGINTQIPLSTVEQACNSILSLSKSANPFGEVFGIGSTETIQLESEPDVVGEIYDSLEVENNEPVVTQDTPKAKSQNKRKRNCSEDLGSKKYQRGFEYESLNIMRQQSNTQIETLEVVKKLSDSAKRIADAMEVLANWTK